MGTNLSHLMAQQIDKVVLYTMNRWLPDSFVDSYHNAPTLETVLAETAVNQQKTVTYALTAPGTHAIWLDTAAGPIQCRVRVQPTTQPHSPLIIYHHGLNEYPYDNSGRRIFPKNTPFPAHIAFIQAPFHDHWKTPFDKGFQSIRTVYQIFAGSLRMMALVQKAFEQQGAAFTILAGVSWGGITSMLYEGMFQRTRAVVPMLSSPRLAQVMWDVAHLFGRDIPISKQQLETLLDFTAYYRRIATERIFPLLGELDQFFLLPKHGDVYLQDRVKTIEASHITGMWQAPVLRAHVAQALAWAWENPRNDQKLMSR